MAHDAVFRINYFKIMPSITGVKTTWNVVASPFIRNKGKTRKYKTIVLCNRPYVYSCQNMLFLTYDISRVSGGLAYRVVEGTKVLVLVHAG